MAFACVQLNAVKYKYIYYGWNGIIKTKKLSKQTVTAMKKHKSGFGYKNKIQGNKIKSVILKCKKYGTTATLFKGGCQTKVSDH